MCENQNTNNISVEKRNCLPLRCKLCGVRFKYVARFYCHLRENHFSYLAGWMQQQKHAKKVEKKQRIRPIRVSVIREAFWSTRLYNRLIKFLQKLFWSFVLNDLIFFCATIFTVAFSMTRNFSRDFRHQLKMPVVSICNLTVKNKNVPFFGKKHHLMLLNLWHSILIKTSGSRKES